MSKNKQIDYTGKTIYVGLDVHRKDWKVCILLEELVYKQFCQPPKPSLLGNYLRKHFLGGTYKSVYEAGFCGFWIHDGLIAEGIENIVVNPADVPTTDKERQQKTDKRDAKKLGRTLRGGNLEGIHIPTRLMIEHRSLVRLRSRQVIDITRTKNRIKAHLHFFGIEIPETYKGCNWSNNFIKWVGNVEMKTIVGKMVLEGLLAQLKSQRQLLLKINRQLRALSKTELYAKLAELLLSVPGIGLIGTMKLLTEIGDIKRFKGIKRLAAYFGFIPSTNSSGEHERVGEMTNRGNKQLKKMLIEASWVAIRNDPALALKYEELRKTMRGTKAIIRIARKLLNRIRYVLINEEKYVIGMVE